VASTLGVGLEVKQTGKMRAQLALGLTVTQLAQTTQVMVVLTITVSPERLLTWQFLTLTL
jgi:hypothetical protein